MTDALIDNPILNSPFKEPSRHWKFTEDGISDQVVDDRRISSYFMPIAKSRKERPDAVRDRMDSGPHRAERLHQSGTRTRRSLAARQLAGRDPDYAQTARPVRTVGSDVPRWLSGRGGLRLPTVVLPGAVHAFERLYAGAPLWPEVRQWVSSQRLRVEIENLYEETHGDALVVR